ncbi:MULTISPECIES: hypothetical protein [unclassified Pseudomonas]|uniref:hypothetical protein n=1 Tax=unclassified Pseudomonas TaxID=196821 RepID=UPI000A1FAE23|nr:MULTISPECIES: hypothetical protein [unclassified Pseudomonas]
MKTRTVNVLMVCFLAGCSSAWGDQQSSPQQTKGRIEFAQKMDDDQQPGGKQCSVSIPSSGFKLNKMSDAGCGNDVVTFFRFVDVPSTTDVLLSSELKCSGGDWAFGVQAYKHPTTSKWVDIRTLKGMDVDTIIQAGLIKSYDRFKEGNIEGKLSCAVVYAPEGGGTFQESDEEGRP